MRAHQWIGLLLPAIAAATSLFGADLTAPAPTTITVSGRACCGKCHLKQSAECVTALVVADAAGKPVTYFLDDNDVSKAYHPAICITPKTAKVTGSARKAAGVLENRKLVEGKYYLSASRIE